MSTADWLALFIHFTALSLLAVGGAITVVPDMHRYLVDTRHWLSDPQFSASVAIAQASPGPNVLFVGLMGWHVGLNAAGYWGAAFGMALSLFGILIPSTTLTYVATRWGHRNRDLRAVRAFKQGMAPIVIALLIATGWILCMGAAEHTSLPWHTWVITAMTATVVWRTRTHLLWLLGAGALLGWFGWV